MSKTIKLIGKHINENLDELEEGYAEIEVNVEDTLNIFDLEDVLRIARWHNYRHEDDFESRIEDFTDDDLIKELKSNGYDFTRQLNEEQCIDYLESEGYKIDMPNNFDELDNIDQSKLEEIINLYYNSSWIEREKIYNTIKSCIL
jgi:hypothetical protein